MPIRPVLLGANKKLAKIIWSLKCAGCTGAGLGLAPRRYLTLLRCSPLQFPQSSWINPKNPSVVPNWYPSHHGSRFLGSSNNDNKKPKTGPTSSSAPGAPAEGKCKSDNNVGVESEEIEPGEYTKCMSMMRKDEEPSTSPSIKTNNSKGKANESSSDLLSRLSSAPNDEESPDPDPEPDPVAPVVPLAQAPPEGPKPLKICSLQTQEVEEFLRSKRKRKDVSLERNFVTPVRAMTDFLLKSADLQGLRKTMRRSAHADEPPITVYWRKDIEAKAIEIWGSLEEMQKEKFRRDIQSKEYNEAVSNIKRILRKYRRLAFAESISSGSIVQPKASSSSSSTSGSNSKHSDSSSSDSGGSGSGSGGGGGTGDKNVGTGEEDEKKKPHIHRPSDLRTGSGKIVLAAIAINGTNFIVKMIAWWYTGSHSLFAEAIHSLADTGNQLILAYGIHKSTQGANLEHPYGFSHMRHVASLISGVGIFCVGAGLSVYHGITGLIYLEHVDSFLWAFYILAGSFVSESVTLVLAATAVTKRAKEVKMSVKDYILRGQDPALNVVILEDSAAVFGVLIAAGSMGLTSMYGSPIPDACGSLVIGGLLAGVASFIIYSNTAALVGRTIASEKLEQINNALESDVMIRAIHDVKGIDMGNTQIRYKAEVDFDGRELARLYVDKLDITTLFQEVKKMESDDEFEEFLLQHGENIVDILGSEIDRIENKLKTQHPEIRHCDLEML